MFETDREQSLQNKILFQKELIELKTETIKKLEKENTELKERIHTLEVYLEGAINYLILSGDINNPIITDVENILNITFNKNPN